MLFELAAGLVMPVAKVASSCRGHGHGHGHSYSNDLGHGYGRGYWIRGQSGVSLASLSGAFDALGESQSVLG